MSPDPEQPAPEQPAPEQPAPEQPAPEPGVNPALLTPGLVNPPLSTPRLRLEPQVAAHAGVMMAALADPRVHLYLPEDPPDDEGRLRQRYARLESRRSPDGSELWLNWTVFRAAEGLGTVQATVRSASAEADVAYLFRPEAWGHGYAAEAMRAVLDHLWQGLGVRLLRATADSRNLASRRLVERLGFLLVGELPGADEFKGMVSDEVIYELAADFRRPPRPPR